MATLVPKLAVRKLLVRLLRRGPEGGGQGRRVQACFCHWVKGRCVPEPADLDWLLDICLASPLTPLFLALQKGSYGAGFQC